MKIVYNIIKSLRPHFFSLREIEENISLDIKIPTNWNYEGMMKVDDKIPFTIKVQDKKTTNTLVSLIAPATVEGYEYVFNYAKSVVTTNKEEEEKSRLFGEKVEELKTLFLSSPLDKLKGISFKDVVKNGLSNSEGTGEIKLGSNEGSVPDSKGETKTN